MKDTLAVTPESPGVFKGVPFGEGCVDFPACFRQLEEQGYRGPYMMEMWHSPGQDWETAISSARTYIAAQFEAALEKEVL